MPKNRLTLAIFSLLAAFAIWLAGITPSQAYTYNNYELNDLSITQTDASPGATNTITLSFTVPDDMSSGLTTSSYVYFNLPYLYRYSNNTYTSDYVDVSSATITSSQLTKSYQGSSYISFYPKSNLSAGATVTVTITDAVNPEGLEGTGSFSVYGSEYNSSAGYYNWFWGSASQAYGDIDLTVTMYDADNITPVRNVSVSLSNYDSYSDYEYHYGYTGSNGQVQFAGLTSGRTYWLTSYYSGTTTNNDPPVGQQVTFNGTALTQSYSFATANVTTHFKDINGNAINNAYWYFYQAGCTNYYACVWRWGYTDSAGLISGAAQVVGSYKLYIQDPSNYNYDSYDFTVNSSGVVSGLVDPIQQTGPEVVGTVTAGGAAVSNAYIYIYDSSWQNYKYDYTDSNGNYSFDITTAGTYMVAMSSYNLTSGYYAPDVQTIAVTPGTTTTLNLALEAATKTISGTVSKKNGDKITDATVYAYQPGGSYRYTSAVVDSEGRFTLNVTGGTWNVYIYQNQWPATWAYTGSSMIITFADNDVGETAELNIKVKPYNSKFIGRVLKPDGTPVGANDVYVYMYGGGNNSVWSYDYTDANGRFEIATTDGSFYSYLYFASSNGTNLSVPNLGTQSVEEDQTKDLGDITLLEKKAHIQGHITIRDTGDPVANQYVYAYRQDGGWDWASATTDANGFFDILVGAPAKWTVYTYASGLTTAEGKKIIYSGGGVTVNLATEDEFVTGQNFFFDVADATASIVVQDDAGNTLTDRYGWASLRTNTSSEYGWSATGCYVQRGSCSVPLASAVPYLVDYYSYHWYGSNDEDSYSYAYFTIDGVQAESFILEADETQEVILVVTADTSTITGNFVDNNGDPVEVTGYVYASGGNNRWVSAYVNNSSSYTLKVSAGTWDVSYWINGGDWMSSYKKSKEVVVGENETVELDLKAYRASATISGMVLDPDGNPVASPVFVQASTSYGNEHTDTENDTGLISQTTYTEGDTGQFSMKVPEGKYYLTASSPDYLSPQPVQVKADNAGSSQNLTLAFINPGTTIHGKVTAGNIAITVNAQRTEAEGDVISDAFVYDYCVGGSYDSTKTNENGLYELFAPADDTCYVGGIYQTEGTAYYSEQKKVKTNKVSVEQDLVLNQSIALPEAQTARFDPREGTVIELENGVRIEIPANAITADEAVTEVVVVVTPTAEAVHQPGLEPISVVYRLTATDADGNPISQFAGDVKIIIPYDEDELADAGTDEDHIQANFYEDAAGTWQAVDGGVIKNKDENQFEISVQHFSVFGIVASRSIVQPEEIDEEEGDNGGEEEVTEEEDTVESGILGIPRKVAIKKRANGTIVITWKQADNAEQYQVKLSTTKKTVRKVKTEQHRVVLKKLKAKKTYRVQVRSLGTTGSKSGWSTRIKVRLSGGKKTTALVQRAEVFN